MEESQLQRDIELELDLLEKIEMPTDEASDQLSLILEKNPEKFAILIRLVDEAKHVGHLGGLVRRIRVPLMQTLLSCWFFTDESLKAGAGKVMDAWVLRQKASGIPRHDFYAFLDLVIRFDVSDAEKAELLAHFVTMTQRLDSHPNCPWPFMDVLTGYPEEAVDLLFPMFLRLMRVDGQMIAHGIPAALWRMPAHFCPRLLDHVTSEEEGWRKRIFDGFSRAMANIDYEKDAGVVDALLARLDAIWDAASENLKGRLLFPYFTIKTESSTDRLWSLLDEVGPNRKQRILGQLVSRKCPDAYPQMIACERSEDAGIRRGAVTVLATHHVAEAKELFRALMDDPDAEVRKCAITGFGAVADPFDETVLIDMMRSPDKERARIAARALKPKPRRETALEANRNKRIRQGAEPHLHMSPIEAIQALPDIRAYPEKELSSIIAGACTDWATTRRHLVMGYGTNDRLMERENGIYELTELGESVWRVGRCLQERGVRRMVLGMWKRE
jgi:hypothetical protein